MFLNQNTSPSGLNNYARGGIPNRTGLNFRFLSLRRGRAGSQTVWPWPNPLIDTVGMSPAVYSVALTSSTVCFHAKFPAKLVFAVIRGLHVFDFAFTAGPCKRHGIIWWLSLALAEPSQATQLQATHQFRVFGITTISRCHANMNARCFHVGQPHPTTLTKQQNEHCANANLPI